MLYCPECGGEMRYIPSSKRYVCRSCGLSVTRQELIELREQNRPNAVSEDEIQYRKRKEYLKWWLSKKN